MANYASIEYFLMIPKILEISLFWFMAYKMWKEKQSTLGKIFAISFIVWTFYTMADVIMWTTAANNPTWLIIDNIIRDIQVSSAVVFAYLIFIATQIIIHGTKGISRLKCFIVGILSVIAIIGLIIVDRIDVYDLNDNLLTDPNLWDTVAMVSIQPNISMWTVVFMIFPLVIFVYSAFTLVWLIHTSINDAQLKKKMYFLIIGIILIPVGILYFTLVLGIENVSNFATSALGRILWMLSPIFIWRSQRSSSQEKY